jgi:hypothetical protein
MPVSCIKGRSRLRVFGNGLPSRIFGPKETKTADLINYIMRSFKSDKIKEDETDWACSTHGGDEKYICSFNRRS